MAPKRGKAAPAPTKGQSMESKGGAAANAAKEKSMKEAAADAAKERSMGEAPGKKESATPQPKAREVMDPMITPEKLRQLEEHSEAESQLGLLGCVRANMHVYTSVCTCR